MVHEDVVQLVQKIGVPLPTAGGWGKEGRPTSRGWREGRMSSGRIAVGLVALWLAVFGVLLAWTFVMYRLFQEGQAVVGAAVGLALPVAVTLVSLLAWGTSSEERA